MKYLITLLSLHFAFNLLALQANSRERTALLITTEEAFKNIPTISTDAYVYLKNIPIKARATRFVFVRHGESTANKEKSIAGRFDVDLTQEGMEQAVKAGQRFKDSQICFDAVYSSPSLRAQKTAMLILKQIGAELPLILDEKLYEKFYGPYEGASKEKYRPVQIAETENMGSSKSFEEKFSFKAHPEMESMTDVYLRTMDFIKNLQPRYCGQTVLVATHNGILKALFMKDAFDKGFAVDYRSFALGNSGIVVVEVKDGNINVKATSGLKFLPENINEKP